MNKKLKQIAASLLSVLMIVCFMPSMAFAAVPDGYDYEVKGVTIPDQTWTGEVPDLSKVDELATIVVTNGESDITLTRGEDFTVKASTSEITDNAEALFTTLGNYSEKKIAPLTFKIVKNSSTDSYEATVDTDAFVYDGDILDAEEVADATSMIKNGNERIEYPDYDIDVKADAANKTSDGTPGEKYAVEISVKDPADAAKKLYSKKVDVTIAKKDLKDVKDLAATPAATYTYDGTAKEATFSSVTAMGKDVTYTISGYKNNVNATTADSKAVATIAVKSDDKFFTGTADIKFDIAQYDLGGADIQMPRTLATAVYTGKKVTPDLGETVYFTTERDSAILPKADYEFEYDTDFTVKKHGATLKAKSANVKGSKEVAEAYEITAASLKDAKVELKNTKPIVAGTDVKAAFGEYFSVKFGDEELAEGKDFTVAYTKDKDNHDKAEAETEFTLTGTGNFKDTTTASYKTVAELMADKYTTAHTETYDGTDRRPDANALGSLTGKVGDKTVTLTKDDYMVTDWSNNVNATTNESKAIAKIEGKGKFEGQTSEVEFVINKMAVNGADVKGVTEGSYYVGQVLSDATVELLKDGKKVTTPVTAADYEVKAAEIKDGYLTKVSVEVKNNYEGTISTVNFAPVKSNVASLNNATVSETIPAGLKAYDAATIKKFITVTLDGKEIGADAYELKADNITLPTGTIKVGDKIQIKLTQTNVLSGTKEATLTVVARDIAELKDEVSLSQDKYEYSGEENKPEAAVAATDDTNALVKDTDFEVSYANNTDAGKATVTVSGKGNYTGSVTKEFTIDKHQLTSADFEVVEPAAADRQFKIGPAEDLSAKISLKAKGDAKFKFDASDYTVKLNPNQEVKATDSIATKEIAYTITVNKDSKNYKEDATGFAYSYKMIAKTVKDAKVTVEPNTFEYKADSIDAYKSLIEKIEVVVDGATLTEGTDYTVALVGSGKLPSQYTDSDKAPYVEITFKGNYAGIDKTATLSIVKKAIDLSNIKLVAPTAEELVYGSFTRIKANDIGKVKLPEDSWEVVYSKDGKALEYTPYEVGTYKATVTATEDYGKIEGESLEFTITKKKLSDTEFEDMTNGLVLASDISYDEDLGEEYYRPVEYQAANTKTPNIYGDYSNEFEVVSYDKTWDGDYEKEGNAVIALKADSNYAYDGTCDMTFEWTAGELKGEPSDYYEIVPQTYTGKALEPTLKVKDGCDVSLSWATIKYYENNVNASAKSAKAYVEIDIPEEAEESKYYTWEPVKGFITFAIVPAEGLVVEAKDAAYTGSPVIPEITVKDANGAVLKEGTDYSVAFENNTYVGEGTVTVTGKGNYAGTATATFKIKEDATKVDEATKAADAAVKDAAAITEANGYSKEDAAAVKAAADALAAVKAKDNATVKELSDATKALTDAIAKADANKAADTAANAAAGVTTSAGYAKADVTAVKKAADALAAAKAKSGATAAEIQAATKALNAAVATANTNAKKAPAKVKLNKKKTKSAKKGKITVVWQKVKGAKGYQIKVGNKTYNVKSAKKAKKIVKAKKGKRIAVKVRAYKVFKGQKIYGKWSAAKKVKVKK